VEVIRVGYELDAVQGAVGHFLARRWQGLRGIAVRKPSFGGKQAKYILEPPRELDEHLSVQLPALV
jgi:hypothetical protein